jgi:hypothetical protein
MPAVELAKEKGEGFVSKIGGILLANPQPLVFNALNRGAE